MAALNYINGSESSSPIKTYTQNFSGGIRLLKNAGFSPYSFGSESPYDATLNQVFNRFIDKTGIQTYADNLKSDFFDQNPSISQAVNLYNSLENTFAPKDRDEKAAIVDFLNDKIDTFFRERNIDEPNSLTREEAGIPISTFLDIDKNDDWLINKFEMRQNFYDDFEELDNVLNYFSNSRGALVDTYI